MTTKSRRAVTTLSILMILASLVAPARVEALECGDVNQSGGVLASDALEVLRASVGLVELACPAGLPATGAATPYGIGSDGDLQSGSGLSYVDNGDGTVTDLSTGLMWEKKDDNPTPTIHDKDNTYSFSSGGSLMDGTMKTVFLDTLNDVGGGGTNCFAGHCDWRIPNSMELYSLFDAEGSGPAVDPAFHQSATCTGCTDVSIATCSCTALEHYWSSTTAATGPNDASYVDFDSGVVDNDGKDNGLRVRAVRGAL